MSNSLVWPHLRRFQSIPALRDQAALIYKDNPKSQEKWVKSIIYLRDVSKKGWISDERMPKHPGEKSQVIPFQKTK